MFRPAIQSQRISMLASLIFVSFHAHATFFESRIYEVSEDQKELVVPLKRSSGQGSVRLVLETSQHNAYSNIHFKPVNEEVVFSAGQVESSVTVNIFDNPQVDGTKVFFLKAVDADSLEEDTVKIVIHDNELPISTDRTFKTPGKVNRILTELPDGDLLAWMNQGVVKLHTDGSLDSSFYFEFDPEPGLDSWQYISHAIPLADGTILLGGGLEQFGAGEPTFRSMLWKIDSNGVEDESFQVRTSRISYLDEVLVLPDGSYLLVGILDNFSTGTYVTRMQKLLSDGTLDGSFQGANLFPSRSNSAVGDVTFWDDETLLLAGHFSSIGEYAHQSVAKMSFDGVVDPDFSLNLPEGANVRRIERLSDGNILIAGSWLSQDGARQRGIARYFPDGTEDRSFHLYPTDFDGMVTDFKLDETNRYIYTTGVFHHYQEIPIGNVVRLNLDHGTLDPTWTHGNRDFGTNGGLFLTRAGMLHVMGERFYTDNLVRVGIQFDEDTDLIWNEGDDALTLRLKRLGPSQTPLTVDLTFADTGLDTSNYIESAPQQVTFDPLQTEIEWELQIKNDPMVNGNRVLQTNAQLETDAQLGYETANTEIGLIDKETPNLIDRTYVPDLDNGRGYYDSPEDAILLHDGSILAMTGNGLEGVIKLLPSGERDTNFVVSSELYEWFELSALLQQPDGKVLLGGYGLTNSGTRRPVLIRVDSDSGQSDPDFESIEFFAASPYGGNISAIALQPSSEGTKILIGGDVRAPSGRGLIRLHMNGTVDETFNVGAGFQRDYSEVVIHAIRVSPVDGNLMIGGDFDRVDRRSRNALVMLTQDGQLVESFRPNLGQVYGVQDIEWTPEGDLLVAGNFSDRGTYIVKMDAKGVLKDGFQGPRNSREINDLILMEDGTILVCGGFNELNGVPRGGVARLLPNGTHDSRFVAASRQGGQISRMLMPDENTLYLLGFISNFDRVPVQGIVKVDLQADPNRPGISFGSNQRSVWLQEASQEIDTTTTIHRLGASDRPLSVPFVVSNGTATLDSDIRVHTEEVSFEPGQLTHAFEVSAVDDGLLEATESLVIRFDSLSNTEQEEVIEVFVEDNEIPSVSDASFESIVFQNGSVHDMLRMESGSIAVAGWFAVEGAVPPAQICLLIANPDGGVDASFTWNPVIRGSIYTMVETDSGLLVGGSFNGELMDTDGSTQSIKDLLHVSRTGELLDLELGSVSGGSVQTIAKDASGRYVIGGNFTTLRGLRAANLARLNTDGSLDSTFKIVSRPNSTVKQIGFQQDGRILIGGDFNQVNRVETGPLARLNEDGSLDDTFQYSVNGYLGKMRVLSDDRILLSGGFSVSGIIGDAPLLLLQPDGTLDPTFEAPSGVGDVRQLLELPNGELLVAGSFESVNGQPSSGMIKLGLTGLPIPSPIWPSALGSGGLDIRDVIPVTDASFIIAGGFSRLGGLAGNSVSKVQFDSPSQTLLYLDRSSISISEGMDDGRFTLKRTGNVEEESSVTVSLHGRTATAGKDFEAVTQTVTMAPLELETEIRISALDDDLPESDEVFYVQLAQPDTHSVLGHSTQEIFIRDNDRVGGLDDTFKPHIQYAYTYWNYIGPDNGFFWDDADWYAFDGVSLRPSQAGDDYEEISVIEEGEIEKLVIQPDQSIIIQGSFSHINGIPIDNMARLFPDGSLDETFQLDASETFRFESLFNHPDGGLVWLGELSGTRGVYRLARDGRLDASFNPFLVAPSERLVALCTYPDGRLLVRVEQYDSRGNNTTLLYRLEPNGVMDESFKAEFRATGYINTMSVLSDQSILIGGNFSRFTGTVTRHLARLLPNGNVDQAFPVFDPPNGTIQAILPLQDGSVLVYGSFDQIAGQDIQEVPSPPLFYTRPGMARIQLPSYEVMPIHSVSQQSMNLSAYDSRIDGTLLLPGHYSWRSHNAPGLQVWDVNSITPDIRFDFGLGVGGYVNDAAFAENGDIYLAGNLDSFNGVSVGNLIRIHGDPITVIDAVNLDAEGNLRITVRSLQGIKYALESSSDMVSWQTEVTELAQEETLQMTATRQGEFRFYRVVRLP